MSRPIEASWLAMRRAADSTARAPSLPLVQTLVQEVAGAEGADRAMSVVDVGAGTGANQAWLAAALRAAGHAGDQHWHLLDHDAELLGVADPGEDLPGVSSTRHTASVDRVATLLRQQATPRVLTCSALLDLLTASELDTLVRAAVESAQAALWALSVTGEVSMTPADPEDPLVTELFNADQQRAVSGDRALLGPTAWTHAASGLRDAGWRVQMVSTPWLLGPAQDALVLRWVEERSAAAAGASVSSAVRSRVRSWADTRRAQLEVGSLRVRVGHTDLLALPGNVISVQTSSPSW